MSCRIVKPIDNFGSQKDTRSGTLKVYPKSYCKLCLSQRYKNKKRTPGQSRQLIYGVTPEQYDRQLLLQDNACLICYDSFDLVTPHTDHCHSTGKFRGILCSRCNQALGLFRDSKSSLQRAVRYLEGEL